ncbi:hypothetical protein WA158_002196 [Blastocystis sp. Blastoise]
MSPIVHVASIEPFMKSGLGKVLSIYSGSVVDIDSDAIVNAANKTLLGGGGVDGAIHLAAGPLLLEECKTLNGCETGEAKITLGYNLNANFVIHTVGPCLPYCLKPTNAQKQLLANCYKNSILLMTQNHLSSIAFPCISTGVYNYPLHEACEIAISTVFDTLKLIYKDQVTESKTVEDIICEHVNRIIFCGFKLNEIDELKSAANHYFSS